MEETLNNLTHKLQESKNQTAPIKKTIDENINKFKSIRKNFSTYFNDLLIQIENLPPITTTNQDVNVEESPAGQPSVIAWEWEYLDKTSKRFKQEGDEYILDGSSYGTMYAHSSVAFSSDGKIQLKFNDVSSFGCGGFGIISKQDPLFQEGNWTVYNGTNPVFCLCCTGTWGAKSIGKKDGGEAMQHRLKNAPADNRIITFEFDFSSMLFKVYDPNDTLFSEFDMNTLQFKEELVLIFYTTSSVKHSHYIIFV